MNKDHLTKRKLRIFRNAHRMIFNCIATEQYARGEEISKKLTAILGIWKREKAGGGRVNRKKVIKNK